MMGMVFKSVEDGKNFYHRYACQIGFSVRSSFTTYDDKVKPRVLFSKLYVCLKQGVYQGNINPENVEKRRQDIKMHVFG